jgi:LysR family nitrogen assimilation transcriptional regulator
VNLRRLKYFVKIVDVGSLTLASELLHVAQPALSQQLATLESECKQKLVLRTQKGVVPTEAGKVLHRHAQAILRQVEQARADVLNAGRSIVGQVSLGLAPGTASSTLALRLLQTVHDRHPQIMLHINENFGATLLDSVRNGRMDMVMAYLGDDAMQGVTLDPLLTEELCVVAPIGFFESGRALVLQDLQEVNLLLPCGTNQVRRHIDRALAMASVVPRVVAEMESSHTLGAAVASGLGVTVLPVSAAQAVARTAHVELHAVGGRDIEVPLALCTSNQFALSEPAQVVKGILLELVGGMTCMDGVHTVH